MSRKLVGLPPNLVARKEIITIQTIQALRSKGFFETAPDTVKKERIFKREGRPPFRINIREARIEFAGVAWTGNYYDEAINYITNQL